MKNGNNNDNEINVAGNQVKDAEIVKRTIKDSVFTNLFRDRRYLIQLYKTLHPEDTEVTEDELSDITIHNILTDGIYNDLGFMRGDRLLILVEAQSTWTTNIIIRSLMYQMITYLLYRSRMWRGSGRNCYRIIIQHINLFTKPPNWCKIELPVWRFY